MAHDGPGPRYLEPPVVAAFKQNAGVGHPETSRHVMERSFSQDLQEGTQDLKEAAEQTRNIILDLALDGVIRWVSPSWTDVVGTQLEAIKGHPISSFIHDDPNVFEPATQALRSNDSKVQFVKFAVKIGPSSDLQQMMPNEGGKPEVGADRQILELEGQGIMVYDRASGSGSHTMWMLQPAAQPIQITISLPRTLVESLGVGAEVLAKYLTELTEAGANDPENHPPPMPVLCRVCERSIVPWWFEKHSDLCVQEHKAEMDIQLVQENLSEHRNAIVKIIDGLEARKGRPVSIDVSPALGPLPEYKGMQIGISSNPSSGAPSLPASHSSSPARSHSPTAVSLGHARTKSFAVRRPLQRILERVLDLCDTATDINVPSVKDSKTENDEDFRTQSPQSDSRIAQVLNWQPSSSLESEPGIAALSYDTEVLARAKVEAVHRHQFILEYSERIRQEYLAEVDACITEALEKAQRAHAGEPISSSGSDMEPDVMGEEQTSDGPTPMPIDPEADRSQSYVGLKSMASALRNPLDMAAAALEAHRRPSSQAVSSRSSSPAECPTPKSHRGQLAQPQPVAPSRRSMYIEADANDSDGSLTTSSIVSTGNWRSESPASDVALSRTTSARDRTRKRRSMHLHGLGSASPRHPSPGRYPIPPPSPLRMNKPRLPSGESSMHSPIVSPLLTAGEFMPPLNASHHHRRQSSVHVLDGRGPSSPHLNSLTHQFQQRVLPPSIKDFEIIKPISRGAFGSVYLSKKKATGDYFAIKVLRKSDMVAKNQVTNVKAERAIMMWQGESDFVAKLYWTFSSKEYLYLVMEYLNGGDCASLVKILGGLTEDWAKKYIAEVILGVEHLHERGIVHRDLKPDNLLIDSKGHLKLTDFGLSRMGLVGRQKRALKSPEESVPDLLKQGPFTKPASSSTSRSASFDYHGAGSPSQTPLMTPAITSGLDQPSYFSLYRESSLSKEPSRRASGYRSDSGSISSHDLHHAFKAFTLQDSPDVHSPKIQPRGGPIEEETASQGSASPDLYPLSQSVSNLTHIPPPATNPQMLPPAMALFDPEDSKRRFVGTPDYLAPETIDGTGQDEMSDWWSLGCILFEFLYGVPPFNAETPEQVFEKILNRQIAWPDEADFDVSAEAKDLMNKMIQIEPRRRLGANLEDKFPSGGAEIKSHPWFADINWDTLLEDEAQFIPNPENPEDTEYFDARGATLSSFPEEAEDSGSPAAVGTTPGGTEYGERPHDALLKARGQIGASKRGLMPLHIPPHVARDSRSRRLSEPVLADDFGNFNFKNLPVLEKANKDIVEKMRQEAMQAQARGYATSSQAVSTSNTPMASSPAPSLEGSPLLPMPVKRALSISKGHRPASPSGLGHNSSPGRPSNPSSPLLVQFSAAQQHERRKTSGTSQTGHSLQPGNFFDVGRDGKGNGVTTTSSPVKNLRMPASPAKHMSLPNRQGSLHGRPRSQTVGSQEGEVAPQAYVPGHYKRRSQLFNHEISPSSSDTENNPQAKALLKVQRRRQSSQRMSQFNLVDGPIYRPLDVLICEDHPVSKMVLEKLFDKLKCRTIIVSNGSEALRVAVSQIPFDIILMEFKLPLISGHDVARMIRDTKSANSTTPIICVTGYLKELPEVHQFDSLIQKPPTIPKLTEALAKFCHWKPPPKDFKLAAPLTIPAPLPRAEQLGSQESPSSAASSRAPTMPDSSWKGSSREDSVGSGFFSDLESLRSEEIPVVVSRAPNDWKAGNGGLGILDEGLTGPEQLASSFPPLVHSESAPATAAGDDHATLGWKTPRRKRSNEALQHKRHTLEGNRDGAGAADEGDDEDEDLGNVQVRTRSPMSKAVRQSSKLGQEMMRTNSRGSVISAHDVETRLTESESLRMSLEILEEKMESLQIPEEPDFASLTALQPRKPEKVRSEHSHPEPEAPDAEVSEPMRPASRGHITPPVIFLPQPGDNVKEFEMHGTELAPISMQSSNMEETSSRKPIITEEEATSAPSF